MGDTKSNHHRSIQEVRDILQMLQMFRLNDDDCRAAPRSAETYFASELQKLLNAVANWSRCGIHSSLRVWGRSESQQRRVNHTHVRENLSPNVWLAVGFKKNYTFKHQKLLDYIQCRCKKRLNIGSRGIHPGRWANMTKVWWSHI